MLDLSGLPGEALVRAGLADLAACRATPAALPLSTASDRLQHLGIELPALPSSVAPPRQRELALYAKPVESGDPTPTRATTRCSGNS